MLAGGDSLGVSFKGAQEAVQRLSNAYQPWSAVEADVEKKHAFCGLADALLRKNKIPMWDGEENVDVYDYTTVVDSVSDWVKKGPLTPDQVGVRLEKDFGFSLATQRALGIKRFLDEAPQFTDKGAAGKISKGDMEAAKKVCTGANLLYTFHAPPQVIRSLEAYLEKKGLKGFRITITYGDSSYLSINIQISCPACTNLGAVVQEWQKQEGPYIKSVNNMDGGVLLEGVVIGAAG